MRPWPTTFLYAIVPENFLVLAQLLISGCAAWLFLVTVLPVIKSIRGKWMAGILLAICMSSTSRISWDTLANAQSLSNSLSILSLVFLIRLKIERFSKANFIFFVICIFMLSVQRPANILILVTYFILLIVMADQKGRSSLVALSLFLTISSLFIANNQNHAWPSTYSGYALTGHLIDASPVSINFAATLQKKGAPECVLRNNLQALDPHGSLYCPQGSEWVQNNMTKTYISFLFSHPREVIALMKYGFYGAFTDSSVKYGSSISILPRSIDTLFIGERDPNTIINGSSVVVGNHSMFLPGLFVCLIFLCLVFKTLFLGRIRLASPIITTLIFAFGVNTLAILVNSCFIAAEWTRILEPYSFLITTIAIVGSLLILEEDNKRLSI